MMADLNDRKYKRNIIAWMKPVDAVYKGVENRLQGPSKSKPAIWQVL